MATDRRGSRLNHWHRLLRLGIAFALLPHLSRTYGANDEENRTTQPSAEQILARWNEFDLQHVALHARLRHWMLRHKEATSAPRRGEVLDLLKKDLLPLIDDATSEVAMATKTDVFLARGAWNGAWAKLLIIQDAEGIRNELHPTDSSGQPLPNKMGIHIKANGEDLDYYDSSLRQASVRPLPSRFGTYKLSDFCFIPQLSKKAPLNEVVVTAGDTSTARLTVRNVTVDFDTDTGFVHSYVETAPSGAIVRERFQVPPSAPHEKLPIPSFSAFIQYHPVTEDAEPRVYLARVYVVDHIDLDKPLPDDRFVLSIPAKGRIARFNADGSLDAIAKTKEPIEDVSSVAKVIPSRTDVRHKAGQALLEQNHAASHTGNKLIIFANIGIVVGLLLLVVARSFRRRQKHSTQ